MEHEFDLVTIGAGSGGVAASRRAAAHGARVAIVEAGRVGGTCVLRGCVPKKLMVYAAGFADTFDEAPAYGWQLDPPQFDLARWADAKAAETTRLEGVYRQLLQQSGVELVAGRAQLLDANTVAVGGRRLRAGTVLLACGGHPVRDSAPGIEAAPTSDEFLDLRRLPASAIVAGGGYIGMEFACVLQRLGVPTTVVMRAELPLRGFDEDLRLRLLRELQRRGMQFVTGHEVKRVERSADGYAVALDDGRQLRAELLLNATGRRPNSAGLGLQQVGVEVDPVGAVLTDENCRTRIPSVYAIGDITHRRNLTPVAIAEGRAVVDTLFGGTPRSVDLSTVATAVFTLPPIGTVGMSEAAARKLGVALKIYETEFRPMRSAFAGSPERTYMKLVVAAETDRVLGVHMLGPDAPEIVQSLAVALSCGATKADFDRTIAVHPTAAEEFVLMREPARR